MSSPASPQAAGKRGAGVASPRSWRRYVARPPVGQVLAGLFVATMATLPFVLGANWVNLLAGVAGLLSFGQAGFVGLGAYTYGVLAVAGVSPAPALGAALLFSASI